MIPYSNKPPEAIGFGAQNSAIRFYIANRPAIDNYPAMSELRGLMPGEIDHIVNNTSNHWRKVFNVYAKLLFDYGSQQGKSLAASWQHYRDNALFTENSHAALLFSAPVLAAPNTPIAHAEAVHIIAGKTYAQRLALPSLTWLDAHFAINPTARIIVAPYPDYRQLSNARIAQLITLMQSLTRK